MFAYILKRLLLMIPTLLGVLIGSPAERRSGSLPAGVMREILGSGQGGA